MSEQDQAGGFEKVGERLYRYASARVYYARVKVNGKEFRRSLKTDDRAFSSIYPKAQQVKIIDG